MILAEIVKLRVRPSFFMSVSNKFYILITTISVDSCSLFQSLPDGSSLVIVLIYVCVCVCVCVYVHLDKLLTCR
jgi:hypothetical protein